MTIDDPTLAERTFTATHDRILHALVEQVHDMGLRLAALEAASAGRLGDVTDANDARVNDDIVLSPPAVPTASPRHGAGISRSTPTTRPSGWQPLRR